MLNTERGRSNVIVASDLAAGTDRIGGVRSRGPDCGREGRQQVVARTGYAAWNHGRRTRRAVHLVLRQLVLFYRNTAFRTGYSLLLASFRHHTLFYACSATGVGRREEGYDRAPADGPHGSRFWRIFTCT